MQLSKMQQVYLQTIFDYFHTQGKWPVYEQVERSIIRTYRDFDMRTVSGDLPSGFASAFAFNVNWDQEASLTVPALCQCQGSETELADFLRVLGVLVECYFDSKDGKVIIDGADIGKQLNLPTLSLRKVGSRIQGEPGSASTSWVLGAETAWKCTLAPGMEGIARFNGVATIEQYLEKRDAPWSSHKQGARGIMLGVDVASIDRSLENAVQADLANIGEVARTQLELSNSYYKNALIQSQRSFRSALILATCGTVLIFASVIFLLFRQPANLSYVSLIGGAIGNGVAALNFYLYGQTTKQLSVFQQPLDRIGRFFLANSVCENLEGVEKQSTRIELIKMLMDVPGGGGKSS